MSIAKAEVLARTRCEYIEDLNDLMKQLEAAELVIHQYQGEQASCGSRQVVLSLFRSARESPTFADPAFAAASILRSRATAEDGSAE